MNAAALYVRGNDTNRAVRLPFYRRRYAIYLPFLSIMPESTGTTPKMGSIVIVAIDKLITPFFIFMHSVSLVNDVRFYLKTIHRALVFERVKNVACCLLCIS